MSTHISDRKLLDEDTEELDKWNALAHTTMSAERIPEDMWQLADALQAAVDRIILVNRVIREADEPRLERLASAELRTKLAIVTARERMWKHQAQTLSSERAQAAVSGFAEFVQTIREDPDPVQP